MDRRGFVAALGVLGAGCQMLGGPLSSDSTDGGPSSNPTDAGAAVTAKVIAAPSDGPARIAIGNHTDNLLLHPQATVHWRTGDRVVAERTAAADFLPPGGPRVIAQVRRPDTSPSPTPVAVDASYESPPFERYTGVSVADWQAETRDSEAGHEATFLAVTLQNSGPQRDVELGLLGVVAGLGAPIAAATHATLPSNGTETLEYDTSSPHFETAWDLTELRVFPYRASPL